MSNPYFQFKQFTIVQEKGAMKVTTDACIQGAWTPVLPAINNVLDIGAGTGLLSLMLAQRNPNISIDGIESDTHAANEARDNVMSSPWKDRINISAGDVRTYTFQHKYDLIISNPPFFNNSLLGKERNKNIARHTLSLSYVELLKVMEDYLEADGYFSVMLPSAEYLQWKSLAKANNWFERSTLSIRHRDQASANRVVGIFCKNEIAAVNQDELIIMDDSDNYTQDFTDLLSPFYLKL